jgi:hypothetical protein
MTRLPEVISTVRTEAVFERGLRKVAKSPPLKAKKAARKKA